MKPDHNIQSKRSNRRSVVQLRSGLSAKNTMKLEVPPTVANIHRDHGHVTLLMGQAPNAWYADNALDIRFEPT